MTDNPVVDVDRIDGKPRTVRELVTCREYNVGYYQREFAWKQTNGDGAEGTGLFHLAYALHAAGCAARTRVRYYSTGIRPLRPNWPIEVRGTNETGVHERVQKAALTAGPRAPRGWGRHLLLQPEGGMGRLSHQNEGKATKKVSGDIGGKAWFEKSDDCSGPKGPGGLRDYKRGVDSDKPSYAACAEPRPAAAWSLGAPAAIGASGPP